MSPQKIPEEELLADLERVADDLGRPPITTEYQSRGDHSAATFMRRFDSWNDALAAAGLDPDRRHDSRRSRDGTRVVCPGCDTGFHLTDTGHARCPHCGRRTPLHRAATHQFARSESIRRLATGPVRACDLGNVPDAARSAGIIRRLGPPGSTTAAHGPTRGVEVIYYLAGDERAAVRRFVETNTQYVRYSLGESSNHNPLQEAWDDGLYEILYEQWVWTDRTDERPGADSSSQEGSA